MPVNASGPHIQVREALPSAMGLSVRAHVRSKAGLPGGSAAALRAGRARMMGQSTAAMIHNRAGKCTRTLRNTDVRTSMADTGTGVRPANERGIRGWDVPPYVRLTSRADGMSSSGGRYAVDDARTYARRTR